MEAIFEVLFQIVFEIVFEVAGEAIGGIVEDVISSNFGDFITRHLSFQALPSSEIITLDIQNYKGGIS